MPPGEEIDMSGTFDFAKLNLKTQKSIRMRTLAMAHVLGEDDERKVNLFRRLLRTMCAETGKAGKSVLIRLDACKLSVHCLYDIALNDASDSKMVIHKVSVLIEGQLQAMSPCYFAICKVNTVCVLR